MGQFQDIEGALRNKWEFTYNGKELFDAAVSKRDWRQSRAEWWQAKKQETMDKIRKEGVEITESLANQYASIANTGFKTQVSIKPELQTQLAECIQKVDQHSAAAREYDGWVQVFKVNQNNVYSLRHADWLYFFADNK